MRPPVSSLSNLDDADDAKQRDEPDWKQQSHSHVELLMTALLLLYKSLKFGDAQELAATGKEEKQAPRNWEDEHEQRVVEAALDTVWRNMKACALWTSSEARTWRRQ